MPTAPPARGNIDFDQIQAAVRLGAGGRFQMAAPGAVSDGNVPAYAADSSLTDSRRAAAMLPYLGGVKQLTESYDAAAEDAGLLLSFTSAFAATCSLPVPSGTNWTLQVANSGPGTINIAAAVPEDGSTPPLIDFGTGGVALATGQSIGVFTDGTDYYTVRGYVTSAITTGGGAPASTYGVADRATFFAGFSVPIMPMADSGARHIVMRAATPMAVFARLATPPISGQFTFDILASQDSGASWTSILATPIDIATGATDTAVCTTFAPGTTLAPGNLLRLAILSAGDPPAYSNGFICVVRLDGATMPGWDRATFNLGIKGGLPLNTDIGAHWIVTRVTQPTILYCTVANPPRSDVRLDIQVNAGDEWTTILLDPVLIAAGSTAVTSTTAFQAVTLTPGSILRPILTSGADTGSGYTISLEFQITG